MRPELLAVPGWALKALAPALVLWALCALALAARAALRPTRDDEGDDEPAPARAFWDPRDNAFNGAMALLAGLALGAAASGAGAGHGALAQVRDTWLAPAAWAAPWSPLPVHAYGAMLGISLGVGWVLTPWLARRAGMERGAAGDAYVLTALCAVLGSRVLYVLTNPSDFRDAAGQWSWPSVVALRTGGLVAYGGFLGGWLGSWLFLRARGERFWVWADAAVPSVALGLALTRVGCFLFGCDFGCALPRAAPWWWRAAGTFPRGSPAWTQHVREGFATTRELCLDRFHGNWSAGVCRLDPTAASSAPVHPTQLYESAFGLALFALAWSVGRRKPREGTVALAVAAAYGAGRAALEVLRDDHERGAWAGLSTSQWLGLGSALLALAWLWRRRSGEPAKA